MTDPTWFTTNPEATLRAESALVAFYEGRPSDVAAILALAFADDAEPDAPKHMLVALLGMVDRLADHAAANSEHTHLEVIRETARIVAAAYYLTTEGNETP